jgi:hypothetical protein
MPELEPTSLLVAFSCFIGVHLRSIFGFDFRAGSRKNHIGRRCTPIHADKPSSDPSAQVAARESPLLYLPVGNRAPALCYSGTLC